MEGFGFWIFIGLFFAVSIWSGTKEKIEKQRTLQRMLERNETIDEELVRRLIGEPVMARPGAAYRTLRVIGAFVMVASVPVGVVAALIRISEGAAVDVATTFAMFLGSIPLVVGLGLFIAANFCEKPDQGGDRT